MNGLSVKSNAEIRNYEEKLLLGFTLRQTICLAISVGVSALIIFILRFQLNVDWKIEKYIEPCIPFIVIIMSFAVKPYGVPMEKFILDFLINNVLSNKSRMYSTNNYYEQFNKPYIEPIYNKKGKIIKPKKIKEKKVKLKYIPIK